jgi:hypothetical protein
VRFGKEGLICVFRGLIRRLLIDLRGFLVIFWGVDSLVLGIPRAVESRNGRAIRGWWVDSVSGFFRSGGSLFGWGNGNAFFYLKNCMKVVSLGQMI